MAAAASSRASASSSSQVIEEVRIPTCISAPVGDPDRIRFSDKHLTDIRLIAEKGLATSSVSTASYIASLPGKVLLSKTAYTCEYGLVGAAIGAGIGAGVGVCAGGIGAGPGAIGGGLIGYAGGIIYGSIKVHRETRKEFTDWKKKQNEKTIAEFRELFKDHPALEMCIDPMTTEPMVLPAHCNCPEFQHTMDYETLSDSIKKYKICPLDPLRRKVAEGLEIRIDYRSMGVFNLAYAQLLEAGAKKARLNLALMKGISALVDDLHRHRVFFFQRENSDIQSRMAALTARRIERWEQIIAQGKEMAILGNRLNIIVKLLFPDDMPENMKVLSGDSSSSSSSLEASRESSIVAEDAPVVPAKRASGAGAAAAAAAAPRIAFASAVPSSFIIGAGASAS